MYNTADSIIVGQYVGDSALAAVGASGPILNLLLLLFMGISTGAGILVSQYFGAHRQAGKGYCDLPDTPLYAFGEGMGYSAFAYDGLTFDEKTLEAGVNVTNTGRMAGTETVQAYFRDVVSSVLTPVRQLIAFRQVTLAPGETARVTFHFARGDFSLVNRREQRVTEPGEFVLMIGHSSRDEDLLKASFRL